MNLANGDVGVAYSVVTNFTTAPCPGALANTTVRIAFSTSADNGATFGPMTYVGNNGSANCPYFDGLEPSFTTGAGGEIFGAYVETNASASVTMGSGFPTYPWMPIAPYVTRYDDALAFVTSTDNGTTFTSSGPLVVGNVSLPHVAAFGRTVYIVYENISNGTAALPGTVGSLPISLNLLYSSDAGATWHGPYNLTGLNASQNDTVLGPDITVNATGTVAVSYATNRSCVYWCGFFYEKWGYDIVVATSTTNGTTWTGPLTVARGVGEGTEPYGPTMPALFESAPTTSIRYDLANNHIYVAWSATYNLNATDAYPYFTDWTRVTTWASVSTNGGLNWTPRVMVPAPLRPYGGNSQQFGEGNFNPALGVSGGVVYLTYSYFSLTNGECGYLNYGTATFCRDFTQLLSTSTDGVHWQQAAILYDSPRSAGLADYHYAGYQASIVFDSAGAPLVAYGLPDGWFVYNAGVFEAIVSVAVSSPYGGPSTALTVQENGLTTGTVWQATVDGETFTSTSASFTIANVPNGTTIYLQWNGIPTVTGYRSEYQPLLSVGPTTVLFGPTTVYYNFTTFYGVEFSVQPPNVPYTNLYFAAYSGSNQYAFQFSWQTYLSTFGTQYYVGGLPMPWYFPAGMRFSIGTAFTYPTVSYYYSAAVMSWWNGTGAGGYTGPGPAANLTINGPINETMWMAAIGNYTASFTPEGLPSTSLYQFILDGSPYSALGNTTLYVANLSTGAHWISAIQANSSTAGWEYFGVSNVGSPVILPEEPQVNLSFAAVDLGAAAGQVSFQANGLASGVPWQLSFNGTTYSSDTPWINVTSRPGTFPVDGFPVVAPNGSASYAPEGLGRQVNVTPGSTYAVNFTGVFRLTVAGGVGGNIAPNLQSGWYVPGSEVNLTASPLPGFSWGGWTGTGPGSYTGPNLVANVTVNGPVSESAAFIPLPATRFTLYVNETGLPAGTLWTVYLNGGTGYSTTSPTLAIPNLYSCLFTPSLGTYALIVPFVYPGGANATIRYVPLAYPSTACVTSPPTISFSPQYGVFVRAAGGGAALATFPGNVAGTTGWVASGGSVALEESAYPGYEFAGWEGSGPGSYTGTTANAVATPTGSITEVALFLAIPHPPAPKYTATFTWAGTTYVPGTSWHLSVAGANHSSSGSSLTVPGLLAGTYTVDVASTLGGNGTTQFLPVTASFPVSVTGNHSFPVAFSAEYWVSITSGGHGVVGPSSGWFASGRAITLSALADSGYQFVDWRGAGSGAYTGPNSSATLSIAGPITESAAFAGIVTASTATSFWQMPVVWVGLALVGLAAGLAVGILLSRRGRGPAPATSSPAQSTEETPPGGST